MNDVPDEESIVKPVKPEAAPNLASVAVMVSSLNDLLAICGLLQFNKDQFKKFFTSRIYLASDPSARFCAVGPLIGAPYAVMLLENLAVWGIKKIIFYGWCGAVSSSVKTGDIILPNGAIVDEGTSRHYHSHNGDCVRPSSRLLKKTKTFLKRSDFDFHEGLVWTTDAIYRETRQKIEQVQKQGALAVEMEVSALFSAGRYRQIEVVAVLVVSDEVSTFAWQPGFKDKRFIKSRKAVAEVISNICKNL